MAKAIMLTPALLCFISGENVVELQKVSGPKILKTTKNTKNIILERF